MPSDTLGANAGPEGLGASRRCHTEPSAHRLERHAAGRRLLYRVSMVLPSFVALVLSIIGVYPLLVAPARTLIPTLASMVGAGLSFASVSFSASRAIDGDESRSIRLATAGAMLFRFALGMSVVLALATTRARLSEGFDATVAIVTIDVALRALMAVVALAAIGMVYSGVRILIVLLGPDLELEMLRRTAK